MVSATQLAQERYAVLFLHNVLFQAVRDEQSNKMMITPPQHDNIPG